MSTQKMKTAVKCCGREMRFLWYLQVKKEKTSHLFSLVVAPNGQDVVIMFRMALFHPCRGALFNKNAFRVFKQEWDKIGFQLHSDQLNEKKEVNMVLHCWLDIPNDVVHRTSTCPVVEYPPLAATGQTLRTLSLEKSWASLEKMFSGVKSSASGIEVTFSDITLAIVNDKQEITREFCCHKNILLTRSTALAKILLEDIQLEQIKMSDLDETTLEIILDYIYTGRLPRLDTAITDHALLLKVVYGADKFALDDLKRWCVSAMILLHHSDTCRVDQLKLAERHGLVQLKALCVAQLATNWTQFNDERIRNSISANAMSAIIRESSLRQYATQDITLQSLP